MRATDLLSYVAAIAAAGAALGWVVRQVLRLVKAGEALSAVVTRELGHNGGSSIKDDVHGTAINVQHVSDRVDHLYRVLDNLAEANHLIWPAIEAVANARPPEEKK